MNAVLLGSRNTCRSTIQTVLKMFSRHLAMLEEVEGEEDSIYRTTLQLGTPNTCSKALLATEYAAVQTIYAHRPCSYLRQEIVHLSLYYVLYS